MSRTYKDKPRKHRKNEYRFDHDMVKVEYLKSWFSLYEDKEVEHVWCCYLQTPTTKPKRRKEVNTEWKWWRGTPSWFTNMYMRRPERRANAVWERKAIFQDLEDIDPVDTGKKPHTYYW